MESQELVVLPSSQPLQPGECLFRVLGIFILDIHVLCDASRICATKAAWIFLKSLTHVFIEIT